MMKRFVFSTVIFLLFALNYGKALNLISPANNSPCQDLEVFFAWESNPDAQFYKLTLSLYPNFQTIILDTNIVGETNLYYVLTSFEANYYWKVSAVISTNPLVVDTSEVWTFKTIPAPPILNSPQNGATCLPLTPTLRWNPINNGVRYRLHVALDPYFLTIVKDTMVNATSAIVTLQNYNTWYYWRVAGITNQNCVTYYSIADSFKTNRKPPVPSQPADSATGLYGLITFSWTSDAVPTQFEIQITDDPTFQVVLYDYVTTLPNYTVYLNEPNKTYYWRVKSIFSDCETDFSQVFRFTTKLDKPNLIEPINDTLCLSNTVTFKWTSVAGATRYNLQIAQGYPFVLDSVVIDTNVTTTSFTTYLDKSLQRYSWRVSGYNNNNIGLWSDTFNFTTTFAPPKLLLPANDTNVSIRVKFQWSTDVPLGYFHLQISDTTDFRDFRRLVYDIKDFTGDTIVLRMPNFFKKYYWRMMVYDAYCRSDWTQPRSFTTILLPPKLISPANNSTNLPTTVTFEWDKPEGTETFVFQVATDIGFTKIAYGKTGVVATSIIVSNLEPNTTYYWRVKGVNSEGESQWSSTYMFRTSAPSLETPELISPLNNSAEQPINLMFVWHSVAGAKYYELQISDILGFNIVLKSFKNIADTTFYVTGLENYKEYFWRVQAYNDSATSAWSKVWRFTTQPPVPTKEVKLLSPAKELIGANTSLSLYWEAVPFAYFYHLQLSKQEDFTQENLVINDSLISTTSKFVTDLELDTKYFWRVRAYNTAGSTPWSEVWWFKTVVTSVENHGESVEIPILIHYDPNSNAIRIEILSTNLFNNFKIEFFDLFGNLIVTKDQNANNSAVISCETLPTGTYFVRVKLNERFTTKLIQIVK